MPAVYPTRRPLDHGCAAATLVLLARWSVGLLAYDEIRIQLAYERVRVDETREDVVPHDRPEVNNLIRRKQIRRRDRERRFRDHVIEAHALAPSQQARDDQHGKR